ncbi:unknown [Prevotella sp. CAG:924]|nr:unknown [Prevotella sp. CAG:924]
MINLNTFSWLQIISNSIRNYNVAFCYFIKVYSEPIRPILLFKISTLTCIHMLSKMIYY